jgi:tetratricopeptide (TPR) repeat protein
VVAALRALRRPAEAEARIAELRHRMPARPPLEIEAARVAESAGDLAEAARRWAAVRAAWPSHPAGWQGSAALLIRRGATAEALALLAEGVTRCPDHQGLATSHAEALLETDAAAAAAAFAALRARFPALAAGYLGGARALARGGDAAAAGRVLEEGLARLPEDPRIALAHAALPVAGGASGPVARIDAANRLARLVRRLPDLAAAHEQLAEVLVRLGRLDDAAAALAEARARLPHLAGLAHREAELSALRGRPAEALARWRAAAEAFPADPDIVAGLAEALAEAGDPDGAEGVLAATRAPATPALLAARVAVAVQRRDWPEAAGQMAEAQRRCPDAIDLPARLERLRLRALGLGAAPEALEGAPVPQAGDAGAARALMLRFESLGGMPFGCEFGFVQRAFGADPLGLLRWTAVRPDRLAAMIEAGFAGVGDPAQTRLVVPEAEGGEYMAVDERFRMRTHTFVTRGKLSPERMLEQVCLRQAFLRDRLLRHLAQGSRIFVYRHARRSPTEAELDRLHRALRAHGPATLLTVRQAGPGEAPCRVERRAPGLLVGTISRFAETPTGWSSSPLDAEWLAICRAAAALAAPPG